MYFCELCKSVDCSYGKLILERGDIKMKIVMEEAGQTFIAVIVGLLLLVMVFGVKVGQDTVGILSVISSVAAVQSEDYGTYVDSDAANAQGKLVGSQLIYDTSKDVIEKNTDVNLLDYIMIQRDDEVITASNLGDGEAIYILDVSRKLGASNTGGMGTADNEENGGNTENVNDSATGGPFDGSVCKGDSVYCFLEPGIYTMKLKMVDKNSKVVYRNIDFTVL